jgi:3-oxoacyl-(acyl-carrier-protein) synthase
LCETDKSKYGKRNIDYINTHGTSTPVGDIQELGAIKRVFEPLGYKPMIGSTKSLSGKNVV